MKRTTGADSTIDAMRLRSSGFMDMACSGLLAGVRCRGNVAILYDRVKIRGLARIRRTPELAHGGRRLVDLAQLLAPAARQALAIAVVREARVEQHREGAVLGAADGPPAGLHHAREPRVDVGVLEAGAARR